MTASEANQPQLSIIVPVLNEAAAIADFLAMLQRQDGLFFEVIFADGGSDDEGRELVRRRAQKCFATRWIEAPRGRAVQMNRGRAAARGRFLLFLHVDSRLPDSHALATAVEQLAAAAEGMIAGHFRLLFGDAPPDLREKLLYWEIKARLDRPGCTHGDQGMLMAAAVFDALGGFPEDWPLFEDTRLAERLRQRGRWLLLDAEIETSARRFAREGLRQRQLLNALLMNFRALGMIEFLTATGPIYRQQAETGELRLAPFLRRFQSMIAERPVHKRLRLWYRTGRYVRGNAWQLLLARRVRSGRWILETSPAEIERQLRWFDRCFNLLTDNPVGHALAGLLTWIWFQLQLRRECGTDA